MFEVEFWSLKKTFEFQVWNLMLKLKDGSWSLSWGEKLKLMLEVEYVEVGVWSLSLKFNSKD